MTQTEMETPPVDSAQGDILWYIRRSSRTQQFRRASSAKKAIGSAVEEGKSSRVTTATSAGAWDWQWSEGTTRTAERPLQLSSFALALT